MARGTTSASGQHRVAAGTVFLMYLGLMILSPLIAPIAREVGLAEWQVGAVVSAAALTMVLASPALGRYGRRWGRRRVLVVATASATVSIAAFAAITQLGLERLLPPMVLFLVFLVVRGVWFGLSEAAMLPNVQAFIAETTADPRERVSGARRGTGGVPHRGGGAWRAARERRDPPPAVEYAVPARGRVRAHVRGGAARRDRPLRRIAARAPRDLLCRVCRGARPRARHATGPIEHLAR